MHQPTVIDTEINLKLFMALDVIGLGTDLQLIQFAENVLKKKEFELPDLAYLSMGEICWPGTSFHNSCFRIHKYCTFK